MFRNKLKIRMLFKKLAGLLLVCLVIQLWVFPSLLLASEQVLFYHTDPVGTPLAMTDGSGNVVWQADYKPFGEENSITGSAVNNKRFVGKEKDSETGLDYFNARYMNDKIGRFISVDPVGVVDSKTNKINEKMLLNPQRLNSYAYASNNPYKLVDPDGRDFIYIVDSLAVLHQGHAAAIVGPIDGKWYYDSYGPVGGSRAGQQVFTSESDAMKFAKQHSYTHYAKWITDENANKKAQDVADKWISGFYKSYKKYLDYVFIGNNCQTMVNEMAKKAEIDTFIPRGAPNITFRSTKQGADSNGEL